MKLYAEAIHKLGRRSKRRGIKTALLLTNTAVLALIVFFVFNSTKTSSLSLQSNSSASSVAAINPLDQVSSADIALTVAQVDNLPESTAVANQAQTAAANVAMSQTTDNIVAKPEVVTTALKSKADIEAYTTVAGDTVASLATKFGITSDSIMWSNGLTSNTLSAGTHLTIPPVNGIVYTVKPGDTPASLAVEFKANQQKIIAYNDAELSGLTPGEQVIIPDGTLASSIGGGGIASTSSNSAVSFPWGSGPIYGGNGYDYGYCTWYVATQIPVPSNWGNASSWAYYAGMSGWNVNVTPTVGSIAQTADAAGGEGHVAIVDGVSANGSQIQIRDMNGIAGWGRVGYSSWIPVSTFQHFITP